MQYNFQNTHKQLALLIDPDKTNHALLSDLCKTAQSANVDIILVGGSLLIKDIDITMQTIKDACDLPVYIFPGHPNQVSFHADGILFLSLISGRNPEFLIGNHIISSLQLKKSTLDVFPVGYILIDGGNTTSVEYISNTKPIPGDKNDIAASTAVAGELLGLKAIYLEAGSGAKSPVNQSMIATVKENLDIPLIVGGGIRTKDHLHKAYNSGADIVVIGTAIEEQNQLLQDFCLVRDSLNKNQG